MYTGTFIDDIITDVEDTGRGSKADVIILTGAEADAAGVRKELLADLYEGNT